MAELNINGRMSVKNLKKQFKEAFGASLRVYNGKELADDDARLASIRTGDAKGGDLSVRGNMKVGGFEKKMLEIYGISVQVADAADTQLVPDDVTIASVARFQSGESTGNSGIQVENEASVAAPAAVPAVDIERLIDAALMDGVVTDKERAILIKKATAQGIDPDEFEMVLDAKILEKGAQSAPAASSTPDIAPAVEAAAVAVAAEKAAEEAKAKAKAEAEAKAKAEAEAKAKAEAEVKAKAEVEAKAKAEAEAKAKAEAEAKAKAEAEAKAKKNTKAIAVKANDEGKYMGVTTTGQTLYFVPDANDANSVIATSPYEGMWDEEPEGDIALPDKVNLDGKVMSVIGVGKAAFFACKQITSITLPESITSIGENAFKECIKLTKVVALGETTIGASAFRECSALVDLHFPKVTSIEGYAFNSCSNLAEIHFPKATSIGGNAFESCNKLVSVEFPMVVSIGSEAFEKCSNLTDVQCPEAEKIGGSTFYNCRKLANAKFPKLKSMGASAFYYCESLDQFTIANGVTIIPEYAFKSSGLKKIIIPNSVTEIGYEAFYGSKLEKAIIPSSVLKIGYEAFKNTKLSSVIIPNKSTRFGTMLSDEHKDDPGYWRDDASNSFSCNVTQ